MGRVFKTRAVLLLVMLLIAACVLVSCAPKPAQPAPTPAKKTHFMVGWSTDNLEDPWRRNQTVTLTQNWAAHPEVEVVVTDAGGKTPNQIANIEDLMTKGMDLLMVSPLDEKALQPVLDRVFDKGIPIVTVDRMVVGEKYTLAVKEDGVWIGQQAAKALVEGMGTKGDIVIIEGLPGTTSARELLQGFHAEMKKYPDIRVLASQPGNYSISDAMAVMENFLTRFKHIDGLYAPSANHVYGALTAIENAKRMGEMCIVGVNAEMRLLKIIMDGQVYATAHYGGCTGPAVEAGWRILQGKGAGLPKVLTLREPTVSKANAAQYYDPSVFDIDPIIYKPGTWSLDDLIAKMKQ